MRNRKRNSNQNNPLPFSKQRQSEVYISIKTNASIHENICNNQIVHYDIHRVKSVNSNTEKVGISHSYFFFGMQDGACHIIYHSLKQSQGYLNSTESGVLLNQHPGALRDVSRSHCQCSFSASH